MMSPTPLAAASWGLGDSCPEGLFPNLAYPGRCTNVPPDLQGGAVTPTAAVVALDPGIVAANNAARFGLQLTPDSATQERLIAEVIGQGLARDCRVVVNESPAYGSLPASRLFQAVCDGGQSAAQLLRPAGLVPSEAPLAVAASLPVEPVVQTTQTAPAAATSPAPTPVSAGETFDLQAWLNRGEGLLDGAAESTGLPSWVLLAGVGLAAWMVVGRSK